MKFNKFSVHAIPYFEGFCKCGNDLKQVSNGFISIVLFCPKCESIYEPKLVKIRADRINNEFLEQCRKEAT